MSAMKRFLLLYVHSIVVAAMLAGCSERQDVAVHPTEVDAIDKRRAFIAADSWYAPPPADAHFKPLDNDRFAQVLPALQPEAQAALSEAPFKRITAGEAAHLAGNALPKGAEYVLLRAVVLFEGTGAFTVRVSDSNVCVYHGCLGRHPAPMCRKALVAALPCVPKTVYVSCGMAE
jgi:hypothetical protein